MKKKLFFVYLIAINFSVFAHDCTFLPETGMKIPVNTINSGLNEAQYNEVIDKIESLYRPVVETYGAKLVINRLWKNERVNASTTRRENETIWEINLYGGLPRHPEITQDGFSLVLCHEIGHHLGGSPKKTRGTPASSYWASTEGESDYFATLKCLRRIFEHQNNLASIEGQRISQFILNNCKKNMRHTNDQVICIRSSLAGEAVARMGAAVSFRKQPSLETPDLTRVTRTLQEHPNPQCRLDTYFSGSICNSNWNESISNTNYLVGACYSNTFQSSGSRPFCWFNPSPGKPQGKTP